ncbi:DNA-directed RNA polymerase subunit beta [Nocardia sp. NPDC050630]|uniref:DNA-directed RNA polymerase subunit beta n=1 Tax=Nocardia sp. NPDC050630 TaxID=3364321 RepID=UPI0037ACB9F3
MDHIAFGDTPLSRCHFYRRVCDLSATVDPPHLGRIIMKAEHVWALILPTQLGQAVKSCMQQRASDIGPVLSHPRSNRWTLLVRPDIPDDVRLFAEMFRLNVSVVRTGGTVALPSPTDKGAQFRRWIEPPRCTFRPSGLVVVDAIRACSAPYRPARRGADHARNAIEVIFDE